MMKKSKDLNQEEIDVMSIIFQKMKTAYRSWLKRAISRGRISKNRVSRIMMRQVDLPIEDMDTDLILICLACLQPQAMRIDARLDPEARRMLERIHERDAKKGYPDI